MTLIELMVAMVIGLGLTLAVSSLVVVGENHKRTTTSTNDAEQSGAYAFYALDRALRGAGSAIAESVYGGTPRGVLSCKLTVKNILPRPGPFPPPFQTRFLTGPGVTSANAVVSNLRVAPVLIAPKGSDDGVSDALVVMGGSGSAGGVSRQITGIGSATSLVLDNSIGFGIGAGVAPQLGLSDLVLVSQNGVTDCLLEQVTTQPPVGTATLTVGAAGTYYTATGISPPVTTLATLAASTATYVTPLGNSQINNVQFLLFGVGANNRTLYSYDLLQNQNLIQTPGSGDASQAIADGVAAMYAIYGVDNNADGIQDAWVDPALDANYEIGTLMTNAAMTNPATMQKIVSVRVGLILRGDYYDKHMVAGALAPVSPATITVFNGLTNAGGASLVRTLNLANPGDRQYRYRVFEFTVPLRNMLLLDK